MIARPPVWVHTLAARFWASAGDPPPFPRDLRDVLCFLPTPHIREVPQLTLASAARHFAEYGVPCRAMADDRRRVAGCFAGYRGVGVILYDPTLDPAEVRFTLAHELAHFLHDYDAPRRRVADRLGTRALESLDGRRAATADERLAGVLRGVAVVPLVHLLDRDRWGRTLTAEARAAEDAADRLAFELLAPFDAVNLVPTSSRAELVARLTSDFGLPPAEAAKYAAALVG